MRNLLAYVMTPTQAISLDAGLDTLFQGENVHCDVLINWPGLHQVHSEIISVIRNMLKNSHHSYRTIAASEEMFLGTEASMGLLDPQLNKAIVEKSYSHLFYSHDVVGNAVQALCQMLPNATRVCIGDALGMVCDRDFHVNLIVQGRPASQLELIKARAKKMFKVVCRRRTVEPFRSVIPDRAVLILPVDQAGTSLWRVPVTVPKKELVRKNLQRMFLNFSELKSFSESVLQWSERGPLYTMLMENFAEGEFMTFDREVDMYAYAIRRFAPKGSFVVIKGHPGETLDRFSALKEMLKGEYSLLETPRELRRIPIEIWSTLIERSEFIALSYPSLSLTYLYDKEVKNPVDDSFIEKWFPKQIWDSLKDSHKLYSVPTKRLPQWNGTGLLARGPL